MFPSLHRTVRTLLKSPGFTVTAILTLALALGANTAIFSLLQSTVLQAPPFPQPERLMSLRCKQPALPYAVVADFHEYLDWKEQTDLFSDVMIYNGLDDQVLNDGGTVTSLSVHQASANYLRTLGLRPALGRDLSEADTVPGAAPVALLSYAVWQSVGKADPAILGRAVALDGKMVTVVGVLPQSFVSVTPEEHPVEALLPLTATRESAPRGNHTYWVYARLRDGVTLRQAEQRIETVSKRLQQERDITHDIVLETLQERTTKSVRPRLYVLVAAVALVLLIACVNLANLQLVRLTGRAPEISIKMALGAGRGRIAGEILGESLLLGLAGGALGMLLADWALDLAGSFAREQFHAYAPLSLNTPVLLYTLGLTLLAVALSGILPAWRATSGWENFLRAVGRSATSTSGQRRLNSFFVVAQVGLTLLVLIGAGLLVRSLHRLDREEKGFRVDTIATFQLSLPKEHYQDNTQRIQFFDQLLDRIQALPGVESAAAGNAVPLRLGSKIYFSLPGVTWPKGQAPLAGYLMVSPGYLKTFGLTLRKGRGFDPGLDHLPAQPGHFSRSIIINESFARKYFGTRDPVGQHIGCDDDKTLADPNYAWDTIVGVISDAHLTSLEEEVEPAIYYSCQQLVSPSQYIVVRSTLDPVVLLPMLRGQLHQLDPGLPLTQLETMQGVVDQSFAQRRTITWTIGAAAAVALALAMLGLYSVIATTVAQQTRDIGVRLALGAEPGAIGRWVLAKGLRLVAAGLFLGLAFSYVMARLLGTLLYGVSAWDPLTYLAVIGLMSGIALLACWLPARRATRVDPMVALRME